MNALQIRGFVKGICDNIVPFLFAPHKKQKGDIKCFLLSF